MLYSESYRGAHISRDEMNLAEFPLTVLSTRVSPKIKTLEFKDAVVDKNGRPAERRWIITAADKFGLPTASDDEVLLGLLKLTVDGGLKDRKVNFTRYELLRVLRWTTEGRSYQRLSQALDRLSGVRIKATNSFYDNESKAYSTKNFGIIDAYEINDGRDPEPKISFFQWSDVLFKSFQVGFIKKLDLDFFLGLSSAVTKRLYRYLDKHFWYKSRVQIGLFTLAHEKIGVSRNYRYPSSIRQQLDPAIDELCEKGFLSGYEYIGKGKHTEVVLYASKAKPRKESKPLAPQPVNASDLSTRALVELESRGIAVSQAARLIEGRGEHELRRILKIVEYFDLLLSSQSHRVSRNPIGFLYRAVQKCESFVLPGEEAQASLDLQNKKKKARKVRERGERALQSDLEGQYLSVRKKLIDSARRSAEPELVSSMENEVRQALRNIEGLISEEGFRRAVEHALDEKLAKLYAVPNFEEWAAANAGS